MKKKILRKKNNLKVKMKFIEMPTRDYLNRGPKLQQ